ncbi:MAG: hypothetical protein IKQ61_12355 [Spirochaetales bacterium]|nr:hypothetical protein [Spirochaetales bacterium]
MSINTFFCLTCGVKWCKIPLSAAEEFKLSLAAKLYATVLADFGRIM